MFIIPIGLQMLLINLCVTWFSHVVSEQQLYRSQDKQVIGLRLNIILLCYHGKPARSEHNWWWKIDLNELLDVVDLH